MLCAHAEKLIPLFAGDDLPARDADALRLHLESCEKCRRLAAEYEESRDWMRGFPAPRFDEATLDGMRDSVLREIGRIENRSRPLQWIVPGWNLRFVFAASVALLLFGALFNLAINRRESPYDPKPDRAEAPKDGGDKIGLSPGKTSNDGANNDKQTAINKTVRRNFPRAPIKREPEESPQTETRRVEFDLITKNMETADPGVNQPLGPDPTNVGPDLNRDMLRIEIQTADPNIRIIWFAPKSDAGPLK